MKKNNNKLHYLSIQQTVQAFFLLFILMAFSMRRAESLRVYSGAGITNRESGGISYHGVSTSTPVLPAPNYAVGTDLVSSSLPRTIGDVVVVSDGPIVNEGTVSTSAGSLILASRVGVEQNRLALATEHVQIITPGDVSFGSGSVTGVLHSSNAISDGQTSTQPAVQVIASAIAGVGCTVGDLSATPIRSIELVSTQGGIEFGPQYVTTYRSKKTLLGGKKSSTEVQVIPPVFRGPIFLSSATFARFTAAQFLAPVEYTSYLNAREDITLQGAIASRSEMSSQLLGRASSYSEQLVPTFATHGLCVHTSGPQSITLQGFIPTRQLSLNAPIGIIKISAMPLHSYRKKTGLGVGIEASSLMGMVHGQTDLTPVLLGERKTPKISAGISLPFQSYVQQLQNPEQPDWANVVNGYAAGKEAYGLYKFFQEPGKHALFHVGGRLSYASYEERHKLFAATQFLLTLFEANARLILINGVSIQAQVMDIVTQVVRLQAELATSSYTFDSVSAGLSMAIIPGIPQSPLTISGAIAHASGYSECWVAAELLAHRMRLKTNELSVLDRGRVIGATGSIEYQHRHLSGQQNRLQAMNYGGAFSSGGSIHVSWMQDHRQWRPYRSEIALLDQQHVSVKSTGVADSGQQSSVALDLSFIIDAITYLKDKLEKQGEEIHLAQRPLEPNEVKRPTYGPSTSSRYPRAPLKNELRIKKQRPEGSHSTERAKSGKSPSLYPTTESVESLHSPRSIMVLRPSAYDSSPMDFWSNMDKVPKSRVTGSKEIVVKAIALLGPGIDHLGLLAKRMDHWLAHPLIRLNTARKFLQQKEENSVMKISELMAIAAVEGCLEGLCTLFYLAVQPLIHPKEFLEGIGQMQAMSAYMEHGYYFRDDLRIQHIRQSNKRLTGDLVTYGKEIYDAPTEVQVREAAKWMTVLSGMKVSLATSRVAQASSRGELVYRTTLSPTPRFFSAPSFPGKQTVLYKKPTGTSTPSFFIKPAGPERTLEHARMLKRWYADQPLEVRAQHAREFYKQFSETHPTTWLASEDLATHFPHLPKNLFSAQYFHETSFENARSILSSGGIEHSLGGLYFVSSRPLESYGNVVLLFNDALDTHSVVGRFFFDQAELSRKRGYAIGFEQPIPVNEKTLVGIAARDRRLSLSEQEILSKAAGREIQIYNLHEVEQALNLREKHFGIQAPQHVLSGREKPLPMSYFPPEFNMKGGMRIQGTRLFVYFNDINPTISSEMLWNAAKQIAKEHAMNFVTLEPAGPLRGRFSIETRDLRMVESSLYTP
jgi:hypothetical protein